RPVVVLHVTDSRVPMLLSSVIVMSLLAVTAVVATVTVVAAAAMVTEPAGAAPQVPPELEQLLVEVRSPTCAVPKPSLQPELPSNRITLAADLSRHVSAVVRLLVAELQAKAVPDVAVIRDPFHPPIMLPPEASPPIPEAA